MTVIATFPACHRRGGVERVAFETLRQLAATERPVFVGEDAELPRGVAHVAVADGAPGWPGLLSFRRRAKQVLDGLQGTVVSYGVQCPVGDVVVVGSVHAAWLRAAPGIRLGPMLVPGRARMLRVRHQALLHLERRYFGSEGFRLALPCSSRVADDLTELYGVPHSRMRVVPNGFDPGQCSPARAVAFRDPARSRWGFATDDVVLLLVANELHRKGFAQLLEATARLGVSRVKVLLVGRMPPTGFRSLITRSGLTERVVYAGPLDDIALAYAAADLFVLPTQYEPFGSVIVEALACGLPVVTSALAGAADAVGEAGTLLADPLDVDELTEALRTGMDGEVRDAWRTAAPDQVSDYTWESVTARSIAAIKEVNRSTFA